MRSEFFIKFWRRAAYAAVVVSLPLVGWFGWWGLGLFGHPLAPETYIVGILLVVGILVVLALTSGLAAHVPSQKDEEIAHLLRAQEEYLTLYEHSPVPYITLDRQGVIKMQNLAAVRLFNTTTDALPGVHASDLFPQTEESDPTALQAALAEHRPVPEAELQIKTVAGELRWVKASFMVFGNGRENLLALVDITKAKEIDAAKSEFVALATHQLRTPLAAIRWNTELLEQQIAGALTSTAQTYLTKVQRNTNRMSDLINDFLSASQLEMGTFSTSEQTISLGTFFAGVVDEFAARINSGNITVKQTYDPPDATMYVDPRLLHIIVSNLLSNAVKYVPDGGGVSISYQISNSQVTITVADTGIGIPVREQEQLFSKFFRASNAREKQAEGTGLGLYVVQQSVHKLHGHISMHSEADVGTTFTVTLPHRLG